MKIFGNKQLKLLRKSETLPTVFMICTHFHVAGQDIGMQRGNTGTSSARDERILLIEDDSDTRLILRLYLGKSGFSEVTEIDNGDKAVEQIRDGAFDLILLDWHMPGLQGIEVLKEARSVASDVPIIMLTAQSTDDRIMEALDAGASSYVTKPFTKSGLMAKINEHLPGSSGSERP